MRLMYVPPNEIHIEGDSRYKIVRHINPWTDGIGPKVWYQLMVNMYGPFGHNHLATFNTLHDSITAMADDVNASQVFIANSDDALTCRWCKIEKGYLESAPAWWFGCNLCETEMDKYRTLDPAIEKVTYGGMELP